MQPADRRNALLCIVGEALWGFQGALIVPMTMLTLVLRHYGAGPRMIGAVTAIEAGGLVLPQMIGLLWFRANGNRKRPIVIWHLATAIPAIALYGIIILALDSRASPATIRWLLLASFTLFMLSVGAIVGAWMDWLACLFHKRIRGTVMGVTFFASSAAASLGGVMAGHLLQQHPGIRTYAWLFLAASAIAAASILQFAFVIEPEPDPNARSPSVADLLHRFALSLRDRNFRNFLIGRLLASFGFCIAPFVAVHYHSAAGGALADGVLVQCGVAATAAAALTNMCLGRLGDLWGHRLGVIVGTLAQVAALGVLLAGYGLPACIAVYACIGVCGGAATVSHNNMLFETCPHDHRLAHITVGNLVCALPLFAAPLIAGLLAEAWGLRAVFVISLFLSIAAFAWMARMVREPRHPLVDSP